MNTNNNTTTNTNRFFINPQTIQQQREQQISHASNYWYYFGIYLAGNGYAILASMFGAFFLKCNISNVALAASVGAPVLTTISGSLILTGQPPTRPYDEDERDECLQGIAALGCASFLLGVCFMSALVGQMILKQLSVEDTKEHCDMFSASFVGFWVTNCAAIASCLILVAIGSLCDLCVSKPQEEGTILPVTNHSFNI